MKLVRHSAVAILLLILAAAGHAQAPAQPVEGESQLLVFVGNTQIGREQVHLSRAGGNWIITSTGSYGAPLNLTVRRFELKYTADWQPIELHIDAVQDTRSIALETSFSVTAAINEITQNGITNSKTDQISARTVVLPNNFYAGYEALAARLASAVAGTELPAYVAPQAEVRITVKSVTPEQVQTPTGTIATRKYDVSYLNPGGPLDAKVTIDDRSRLVRLDIPAASLVVVRADLATVATRTQITKNPTDTDVTIPAAGFVLGGTITTPAAPGTLRHPAIVLVGGATQAGRDETMAGVPVFAQLAGALADKGYIVVRYDKRGVGQSGGRTETVTLNDYAEDAVAAVKWMEKRRDVAKDRIAVVGYGEGGWIGMLAATKEKKIASLVLAGAPGTTGAELVLEQQRHALDLMQTPAAERQTKIDLQTRIHAAVISGTGWDAIPPEMRRPADTPWFRSLLLFDPAKVMARVKQPILIVQGGLDMQVPKHHADLLAGLARARKKAPAVEVTHIAGLNHLLVPAKTGEVAEYSSLPDKRVAPAVAAAIADWLRR